MAEINTQMYQSLGQQQGPSFINMIQGMGTAAEVQTRILQNRQLQLEFAGKQALGHIMQESIDPQSGQVDYNKAAVAMSVNPATAWMAPGIISTWLANQKVQAETVNENLKNANDQLNYGANALKGLMNKGDNVTMGDFTNTLTQLRTAGVIKDPNVATSFLQAAYAAGGKQGGKPLASYIQQLNTQLMPSVDASNAVNGALQMQDVGPGVQVIRVPSIPGQPIRQQGYLPKSPTPEQMNELGGVQMPSGEEKLLPRYQRGPMVSGEGQVTNPPGKGQGGGQGRQPSVQPIPQPMDQGSSQGLGQSPPPQGQSAGQPASPPQGYYNTSKLSPEDQTALQQGGEAYAQYAYKDLPDRVAAANMQHQDITLIKQALAMGTQTGGGGSLRTQIGQGLQMIGAKPSLVDDVANHSLAGSQIIGKAVIDLAGQSLRSTFLGLGQQKLLEYVNILKSLPNIDSDPKALDHLLNFLSHRNDLTQKEYMAQQRWETLHKQDPQAYPLSGFRAAWQRSMQANGEIDQTPPTEEQITGAEKVYNDVKTKVGL